MRIAVDAMGGDHAPGVVVEGAVQAARDLGVGVALIGPEAVVRPLLLAAAGGAKGLAALDLALVDAPEVVGMDEPAAVVTKKRGSSIVVGLRMLRNGKADAFVSAGSTGAITLATTRYLGRLRGVRRTALAALVPSATGETVLLDVGAQVDVRPEHLEQFAVMGSCYLRAVRGVASPRVALLSVGEEEIKGNDLIRRVHQDLKQGHVNFVGNIDGKQVYSGHADVIVCDGFSGNVVLKASQSVLKYIKQRLVSELRASPVAWLGLPFLWPMYRKLRKQLDPGEYGAVPLLGAQGPVFIGHGSSDARAIFSAIRSARRFVEARVNEAIEQQLERLGPRPGEAADEDDDNPSRAESA